LIQRIRPFVNAKNPGDLDDPETKAFEARIKTEAEDLKLESFGVEVSCSYRLVRVSTVVNQLIRSSSTQSRKCTSRKQPTLSKAGGSLEVGSWVG
jgi:hypothetical protein